MTSLREEKKIANIWQIKMEFILIGTLISGAIFNALDTNTNVLIVLCTVMGSESAIKQHPLKMYKMNRVKKNGM